MHAVAADSQQLALDLHALLVDLDKARVRPSEWTEQLQSIAQRLEDLLDATWPDESLRALQQQLSELRALLADQVPDGWQSEEWASFRAQAMPLYEGLAASLSETEIHVPSLRPTNYARNAYHVANAALIVLLVELVFTPAMTRTVAVICVVLSSSMEVSRRVDPRINDRLMALFGRVAHPHEAHRINSATWYTLAILILAWCFDHTYGVIGVAVLGLGDPMAALIGRKWGQIKLIGGRSLEGSLAFVAFGFAAAWATTALWHPELGFEVALVAAVFGAAAELLTLRIDDNLAVPVAAAFGAWLAAG